MLLQRLGVELQRAVTAGDTLRIIDLVRAGASVHCSSYQPVAGFLTPLQRATKLPSHAVLQILLSALFTSSHPRHTVEKTMVTDILATMAHRVAQGLRDLSGQADNQRRLRETEAELAATRVDMERLHDELAQQRQQANAVASGEQALHTNVVMAQRAREQPQEGAREAERMQQSQVDSQEQCIQQLRDECRRLQERNASAQGTRTALEAELRVSRGRIETMKAEGKATQLASEAKQQRLQQRVENLQQCIALLAMDNNKLAEQLSDTKAQLDELQAQYSRTLQVNSTTATERTHLTLYKSRSRLYYCLCVSVQDAASETSCDSHNEVASADEKDSEDEEKEDSASAPAAQIPRRQPARHGYDCRHGASCVSGKSEDASALCSHPPLRERHKWQSHEASLAQHPHCTAGCCCYLKVVSRQRRSKRKRWAPTRVDIHIDKQPNATHRSAAASAQYITNTAQH